MKKTHKMNIADELSQRRLLDRNKHSIDMILGRLINSSKKTAAETEQDLGLNRAITTDKIKHGKLFEDSKIVVASDGT